MSIKKIHLWKVLKLLYAPESLKIKDLRSDIRNDIKKETGNNADGGDFYLPFWADARSHALRKSDLREQTVIRISNNTGRERLYLELTEGFLSWWTEKSRWRNEPFEPIPESVKGHFDISKIGVTIKVENLLALHISGETHRIIYPYFSEDPRLSEEGSRIGIWLIKEALSFYKYKTEDMYILDILRGISFSIADHPLHGDEEDLFTEKYARIIDQWNHLRLEYK